ncbi:MAG: metalloregulator ArsR/SmtB family transcription factor [Rhodococcus sp. (in: high G+C Gram-positive bacteria)]|uniref:ArsR/SmtB family transcription factor n=1 Tax=Rhodococcus sp. TaxID=1831 RepID=UPI003BAF5A2E
MEEDIAAQLQELHARVCKAIADPKRLLIINELRDRELSVGELCEALGFSQSNASQHLTILRERGIVSTRRAGSNVFYSLRSQKIVQAVDLLREFLAEDLADRAVLDDAIRG